LVRDVWQISNLDNSANGWVLHSLKLKICKLRALIDISASIIFPTFVWYIHLYSSQQWRHVKKFRFRVLFMCYLRMAVMHLPTKFCANSAFQFEVIDIFQNPRRRPPSSWIFKWCTFGTFPQVNSVVLELYIKFGSNICDGHWVTLSCVNTEV